MLNPGQHLSPGLKRWVIVTFSHSWRVTSDFAGSVSGGVYSHSGSIPNGSCTGVHMSLTHFRSADQPAPATRNSRVTIQTLQAKKSQGRPIVALTAYDYATARLVDEAGVDVILVGDSLAMVVMGYDNTLPVTMDEMLLHTRAVRRAVKQAMVVADMPFGSYQVSNAEGVSNAVRFIKESGAQAG